MPRSLARSHPLAPRRASPLPAVQHPVSFQGRDPQERLPLPLAAAAILAASLAGWAVLIQAGLLAATLLG